MNVNSLKTGQSSAPDRCFQTPGRDTQHVGLHCPGKTRTSAQSNREVRVVVGSVQSQTGSYSRCAARFWIHPTLMGRWKVRVLEPAL